MQYVCADYIPAVTAFYEFLREERLGNYVSISKGNAPKGS